MEPYLQEGIEKIQSLEQFFEKLQLRFTDPHAKEKARDEFYRLYQNNKELLEYLGEFHRLAAAAEIATSEQILMLNERLSDDFKVALLGKQFSDMKELVNLLHLVNRQRKFFSKPMRQAAENIGTTPRPKTNTSKGIASTKTSENGSTNDTTPTTEQRQPRKYVPRPESEVTCFSCQKKGHFSRNCPDSGKESPHSQS